MCLLFGLLRAVICVQILLEIEVLIDLVIHSQLGYLVTHVLH